ncbi:M48 family metalloprotease [Leptolyngbya sp. PCC 6406]|uniref:M48 family metalloprotease n=1 Tax=Leptolyngbya sp. PCC 6406 TaxID=1173264 RepID=UPI0002AD11CE|nr:M48 family metalloprotease [Leptolyngbya sp. PCC 6406]
MASPPPSSSPEVLLQSGLTALKRQDYAAAIAILSPLPHHGNASTPQRLKAEMALVRAHLGLGDITTAIARCQELRQNKQPQVRQWAEKLLAELASLPTPKSAGVPTTEASGFRPLTETPPAPATNDGKTADATGFRPLTPTPIPSQTPGFTPLTSEIVAPETPDVASSGPVSLPPQQPPSTVDPAPSALGTDGDSETHLPPPETAPIGASLFHYQTLNQGDERLPAPTADRALGSPGSRDTEAREDRGNTRSAPAPRASVPESLAPTAVVTVKTDSLPWQLGNAERLETLRSLNQPTQPWVLWLAQAATLLLTFVLVRWLLYRGLELTNSLLRLLDWLFPMPRMEFWIYRNHTPSLAVVLGALLLAAPWILDWILARVYGQTHLSTQSLKESHPEAVRLMRRICQQRGWVLPNLRSLPLETPLIFSYGWLPRNTRIVVSQGLLNRLEDAELATLYGQELAHMVQWTLPLMSLLGLILQGVYQAYWQLSIWGDRQSFQPLRVAAAGLSALAYGLYWLLRKPSLALVRLRVTSSDRLAVEWTGNPNALVRALVKMAVGTAEAMATVGHTSPLVESVDILTPLGYRHGLTPGSLYPHTNLPQVLGWDWQNSYRHWLALNSAHPPLGDRIVTLSRYARQWGLEPEMPLVNSPIKRQLRSRSDFMTYWLPFLLQISPYLGPLIGATMALVLWFVGGLVNPLGVWQISWFYGDRSILVGSLYLGLGIGIFLRLNRYFPDITPASSLKNVPLDQPLKNPMALPTDSIPIQLQGKLLGRLGMANWLCQDFWLQTPQGMIKVHFLSSLGAFGNLLIHPGHPSGLVGQVVTASGWLRRGADPWLDVDRFIRPGKPAVRSNHPIWSVVIGLTSCTWGLLILLRGG